MKRYRIGKDVANRLRVRTNGEYTPLAGRDISLQMTDPKGCKAFVGFTIVDDYKMLFVFYGKDQKYTGTYQFTVWENYEKTGQTVVDCIGAFRLVANTTLEGGEDPEGLDTEVNDLELDISTAEGGADGVGIQSIEQTTTSTEDGGINEITATLTDGTTSTFEIRNGQRGSQGERGPKGDTGATGPTGPQGPAGEDWIPTQQELASIAQSAAALVDVPTKTSDLTNDSGFVTSNSPSFTGTPTAPTPVSSASADSFQIANVEFVIREVTAKVTNKMGQPNGIASLDSNGKVPSSQLPSSGGGDVNVIEIVKVNGTALTPDSNKAVDVLIPSWAMQSSKPSYTASEVGALPASTTIPSALADLSADSTHRTVTDTEKSTWNNKSNFSGSYNDLSDKPTIPTVPSNVSAFTNDSHYVASTAITNIVSLTQAQYDALATKDANTLYIIPES